MTLLCWRMWLVLTQRSPKYKIEISNTMKLCLNYRILYRTQLFVEAILALAKPSNSLISEVFSLVDSSNISAGVPLSQKQLTDPPSPKMMCEAKIDIAQDSLPGDRFIHDCQKLMGFSDIF